MALVVKNSPANAGDIGNTDSIHGSGRSPGEGNGSPPQYSCLENLMDRGSWRATVHRVAKSQTGLKLLSTHHTQASSLGGNTWKNLICEWICSLKGRLYFKRCQVFSFTDKDR